MLFRIYKCKVNKWTNLTKILKLLTKTKIKCKLIYVFISFYRPFINETDEEVQEVNNMQMRKARFTQPIELEAEYPVSKKMSMSVK